MRTVRVEKSIQFSVELTWEELLELREWIVRWWPEGVREHDDPGVKTAVKLIESITSA